MSLGNAAINTVAGSVHSSPEGGGSYPTSPYSNLKKQDTLQFYSSTFVNKTGTGETMRSFSGGERKERNPWTNLSRETRENYTTFLRDDYIPRLRDVFAERPDLVSQKQRELFKAITGVDISTTMGPSFDVAALNPKVDAFLRAPSGFILSTMAMEEENEKDMYALELIPKTNPVPSKDAAARDRDGLPIGDGEGPLGYPMRRFGEWWSKSATAFGGREGVVNVLNFWKPWIGLPRWMTRKAGLPDIGIGLIHLNRWQTALWLTAGGIATATGVVGAAAVAGVGIGAAEATAAFFGPAIAQGFSALVGRGVAVDKEKSATALNYIKSNADRAEYTRLGLKVNVLNRSASINGDQEGLRLNIEARNKARYQFLKEIKADRSRAEAIATGFLFDPEGKGYPEKTLARWQEMIANKFDADNGGVRDINGNYRKIKNAAGEWVDNNAANNPVAATRFDSGNVDYFGNLQRYDKAREEVWMHYLEDYIDNQRNAVDDVSLQTKIDLRSGEAEQLTAEDRAALGLRRANLEQDRTVLGGEVAAYANYDTHLDNLQETRQSLGEARLEASRMFGASAVDDLERLIRERIINVSNRAVGGTPAAEVKRLEEERRQEIRDSHASIPATLVGDELRRERTRRSTEISEAYSESIAEVKRVAQEETTELRRLKGLISEKEGIIKSDDLTSEKAVESRLIKLTDDHAEVVGWGVPGADLATKSIEEIETTINLVYEMDNTKGWSPESNSLPENRAKLLNSIIEARARVKLDALHAANPLLESEFNKFTSAIWGISEHQLRTRDVYDLVADLSTIASVTGQPQPTEIEVQSAMNEAKNRFKVRLEATTDLQDSIGPLVQNIDDEIRKLPERFIDEAEFLQATQGINRQFDSIMSGRFDVLADRARFTDRTVVLSTDGNYTKAERTANAATTPPQGFEKGYYEMLNLLFDYRNGRKDKDGNVVETRDEYFKKISKVLTPDRLREVMADSIWGPGTAATFAPDFDTFLNALNTQIASHAIWETEIRRSLLAIVDKFNDEARVM